MSVLENLHDFEQRIAARLQELRPLIDEYEELKRLAERLELDVDEQQKSAPRVTARPKAPRTKARARSSASRGRSTPRSASGRRRPGGTRATGEERRTNVLALVSERPGVTVSEMSTQLGVDAPSLYRVVRRLVADGVIKKQGRELRMA